MVSSIHTARILAWLSDAELKSFKFVEAAANLSDPIHLFSESKKVVRTGTHDGSPRDAARGLRGVR